MSLVGRFGVLSGTIKGIACGSLRNYILQDSEESDFVRGLGSVWLSYSCDDSLLEAEKGLASSPSNFSPYQVEISSGGSVIY